MIQKVVEIQILSTYPMKQYFLCSWLDNQIKARQNVDKNRIKNAHGIIGLHIVNLLIHSEY